MIIKFNTDDDIPLIKKLYFLTITVIIRSDVKMTQYERIDISEEIDFNEIGLSLECMICHYWYFKDIGFKY